MTTERQPNPRSGWVQVPLPGAPRLDTSAWRRGRLLVISQLADMPTNGIIGPTWLLSLSRRGKRRPNNRELHQVLKDFAMPEPWDEDNHEPGIARKVFCPVNPAHRTACECKTDEIVVVEPDGYRWSRKKDDDE